MCSESIRLSYQPSGMLPGVALRSEGRRCTADLYERPDILLHLRVKQKKSTIFSLSPTSPAVRKADSSISIAFATKRASQYASSMTPSENVVIGDDDLSTSPSSLTPPSHLPSTTTSSPPTVSTATTTILSIAAARIIDTSSHVIIRDNYSEPDCPATPKRQRLICQSDPICPDAPKKVRRALKFHEGTLGFSSVRRKLFDMQ